MPNLIADAVPFFVFAIVLEGLVDRVRSRGVYRFGAAIADLNAGITSQVGDAFFKGIGVALYTWVYAHFRLVTLAPDRPLAWVVGLVGIDFLYYVWHRASHEVNLLWAVHAVHHQSEDFNLAVALRQPAFESLTIVPFHLPLAFAGVDARVYVACYALDLIYQFFVHTELVGTLGPLEKWLNTPSLHRVHHGIDPIYLDRNFGGILAIWDRLFGTYEKERQRPVYGVTHPLGGYDVLRANVVELARIARLSREAHGLADRVRAWLAHPRWQPLDPARRFDRAALSAYAPGRPADSTFETSNPLPRRRYDPFIPPRVRRYLAVHFLLVLAAGGAYTAVAERLDRLGLVAASALLLGTTFALGAWLDGRRWAPWVDGMRQVAIVAAAAVMLARSMGATTAMLAAAALGIAFAVLYFGLRPAGELSKMPSEIAT